MDRCKRVLYTTSLNTSKTGLIPLPASLMASRTWQFFPPVRPSCSLTMALHHSHHLFKLFNMPIIGMLNNVFNEESSHWKNQIILNVGRAKGTKVLANVLIPFDIIFPLSFLYRVPKLWHHNNLFLEFLMFFFFIFRKSVKNKVQISKINWIC